MKKFGRKLLGLCLAASLAVTAVPPTQGMAAQGSENVYAGQTEQPDAPEGTNMESGGQGMESGEIPGQEPETGNTGQSEGQPDVTEEQKPEGETEDGKVQPGEDTQQPATEPETGEQKPGEDTQQPATEAETEEIQPGEDTEQPTEEPGVGMEDTQKPEEEEAAPGNTQQPVIEPGTEEIQPGEDTEQPTEEPGAGTEDTQKPEEEDDSTQITGTIPGTESTEKEENTEVPGEFKGEESTRRQDEEESDIDLQGDRYDIDQPVIESVDFLENGQVLTADDTLHFNISTYDADSGIASVTIHISCKESYGNSTSLSCKKSETGNLYTGTFLCSDLAGKNYYISTIRVTDRAGNYTEWDVWDNGEYLYHFSIGNVDGNVSVSNVQMKVNDTDGDGRLSVNDTVTYTADIACKDEEIRSAGMRIHCSANGYDGYENATVSYDETAGTLTGTYVITDRTYPVTWRLYDIYCYTKSGKSYYFYSHREFPDADLAFDVVQEEYDTEKPVIESITLDKNGQEVKPGDVVTITVKASDAHLSETAYARFVPMVSNVSQDSYVNLKLNEASGEYTGTIAITEDTYPCEWDLTSLTVYDEVGHRTGLSDFCTDFYRTYPWYYRVRTKNTYAENKKNVTFEFYGFARQENGIVYSDSLISSETVENVGRRASLKELGVAFPQTIGVTVTEWKFGLYRGDTKATIVDENTKLLFGDTSDMTVYLTAFYDKVCANVSLEYMTKKGETKIVYLPQFVDKGTTYKEVLGLLKLPEDARSDDFAGLRLNYSNNEYNEDTRVEDTIQIPVKAIYNSNQVACTLRYLDKNGNTVTDLFSKAYPEGTKIREVLSDLKSPEAVNGAEFEKWILPGFAGNEENEIELGSMQLDVTAVYRGKTTVDTLLVYRGADGKMAESRKMILADGENPSDASLEGQATGAFKDAEHYKGLRLSEWKGNITKRQKRYREVRFTANYYNCFITLKDLEDVCEYVVADRGAKYTLPVENEKYKEIVWEGYEKGATVTIRKDMEFTMERAERKGDASVETGGQTLPEEVINEIVKAIQNAGDGETITIDMNGTTVIPQEVLEALQGKDVTIVLNMGTYTWTINGTDVAATNLKDIDLEVRVDADAIPSGLVNSLAGGKPATQLSLTHNGPFGFKAELTLNVGTENSGDTGNLYYYDSTGKLVFVNSGQIAEDGTICLSFSHASDYVIIVEKGRTAEIVERKVSNGKMRSPKTGE